MHPESLEPRRLMSAAPKPDHVVVLILNNLSAGQVYGNASMPFLNGLASSGAEFTNSQSVSRSQNGNDLALYTGNAYGWGGNNLGQALSAAGLSFGSYEQHSWSHYRDRWDGFPNAASDLNSTGSLPSDFASLPTVSFVVQTGNDHDSGDALAATDQWAQQVVGGYSQWAAANNSLLIVTSNRGVDDDNDSVPTIFFGANVAAGISNASINDYNLLSTIEADYGITPLGHSAQSQAISVAAVTSSATAPAPAVVGSITSLELLDAGSQVDLGPITNGQTIAVEPGQSLAIRAQTSGQIGSILFQFDSFDTTVNSAPFDLFGTGAGGISEGVRIGAGTHVLSATAYSGTNGQGTVLTTQSVQFNIVVATIKSPTVPPPIIAPPPAAPPPPTVPPPPPPVVPPPPPPVGTLTGLELYDGATGDDLGPITNGETITETSGQMFAIRGSTSGAIGSIQYQLDGTTTETDDSAPYDVFGTNSDGSSQATTIAVGSHTLTATPYSAADAQGTAGSVYSIQFSIAQQTPPPPPPVGTINGLELFDGATGDDLGPITDGETITETSGQTFAIRGSTSGDIGSIQYQLDGSTTQTDDSAPYDVFGTNSDGSSEGATIAVGSHTLTATPYSSADAQGVAGSVYSIQFSIAQQTPPPPPVVPPTPPPPPPVGTITGLELYDGATGQDLGPITNGETISETPGQTFAVRGSISGAIGSVQYQLDGMTTATDDGSPYDLFGTNSDGSSEGATIDVGSHTLTATPYSDADAQGTAGSPYTIQFAISQQPPVGTVTNLELYDGATGQDLGAITDGQTIMETPGQTFAIRGTTSGAIGSVQYQLDGTTVETDDTAPYDVFGTNSDGSSQAATINIGSHTLTATPYSEAEGQGTAGSVYSIQFSVVQQMPPPPPPPVGTVTGLELYDGTTGQDLGPITNGETITETTGQIFAIRGSTSGIIGSVEYQLDGTTTEIDNSAPYDVFGTTSGGTSQGATITVGSHTLTGTPFSAALAQGTAGSVYSVQFSIVQQTATPPPPVTPPSPPSPPQPPIAGTWNSVFDDEFNGTTLNPIWHTAQYWNTTTTVVGQGELEAYNAAADTVSNGALHITATPNTSYGAQYLSGLVMTGGIQGNSSQPTFSFKYGYLEVRAKLPAGQGLWPAIWMMPAGYKDSEGELDVMENLGNDMTTAYGTVHMNGGSKQFTWHGSDLSAGYHTYAVDWEPDHITWYIDGVAYGTLTNTSMIPSIAMYPIINLAVGGTWGGDPNASTVFPATMDIDYIRIWQKAP